MRRDRPRRDDPLAGPHSEALTRLLAAAAAPARPGELDGEQAALAAFRSARPDAASPPRKRPRVARLVPVKAAVATFAVAITVVGGGALAASTGALPTPGGSAADHGPTHAASPQPGTRQPSVASTPSRDRTRASGSAKPARSSTASALPRLTMVQLCRAYGERVADGEKPNKVLKDPVFDDLVAAAGNRPRVAAYCAALLSGGGQPSPTAPGGGQPSATAPGAGDDDDDDEGGGDSKEESDG